MTEDRIEGGPFDYRFEEDPLAELNEELLRLQRGDESTMSDRELWDLWTAQREREGNA